jgi:hypothetical protein
VGSAVGAVVGTTVFWCIASNRLTPGINVTSMGAPIIPPTKSDHKFFRKRTRKRFMQSLAGSTLTLSSALAATPKIFTSTGNLISAMPVFGSATNFPPNIVLSRLVPFVPITFMSTFASYQPAEKIVISYSSPSEATAGGGGHSLRRPPSDFLT